MNIGRDGQGITGKLQTEGGMIYHMKKIDV